MTLENKGYSISDYKGDKTYSIECTGDCVVGDEVRFDQAILVGTFPNAKFEGFHRVTARIIKDSYGLAKQQHTFTLLVIDDSDGIKCPDTKLIIKGRNLYRQGTWRKPWSDEGRRVAAADEKHTRGAVARKARDIRKNQLSC